MEGEGEGEDLGVLVSLFADLALEQGHDLTPRAVGEADLRPVMGVGPVLMPGPDPEPDAEAELHSALSEVVQTEAESAEEYIRELVAEQLRAGKPL